MNPFRTFKRPYEPPAARFEIAWTELDTSQDGQEYDWTKGRSALLAHFHDAGDKRLARDADSMVARCWNQTGERVTAPFWSRVRFNRAV